MPPSGRCGPTETCLQWRAGQLPGQTGVRTSERRRDTGMLGLQWRAGQLPGQTSHPLDARDRLADSDPFNGGPGNCPAKPEFPAGRSSAGEPFNGGPGNCPAKPVTRTLSVNARIRCPSMEGRAIARPNTDSMGTRSTDGWWPSMEGRAIARPNRCSQWPCTPTAPSALQWRAGQLPGQTCQSRWTPHGAKEAFNGGPGNCPAKQVARLYVEQRGAAPSMEGRAIARPNSWVLPGPAPCLDGPSMEGRAIARPNPAEGTGRSNRPSMEGRAIARPNDHSGHHQGRRR